MEKNEAPIICVFPCDSWSEDYEFETADELRTWLKDKLRFHGKYHLKSTNQVPKLSIGSIVLFKFEKEIVGEGVVMKKGIQDSELENFKGMIQFVPSSIRIYKESLKVEDLEQTYNSRVEKPKMFYRTQAYLRIENEDFGIYGEILGKTANGGYI